MIIKKNDLKTISWCMVWLLCIFSGASTWADNLDTYLDSPKEYRNEIIAEVDKAEATYKQRLVVEPKLIRVLNASGYSQESKTFIAEQLYRLCDEDTVEAFEKMLYRNDTSILAAKGLGIIKQNEAQRALLRHISRVNLATRVAIIEALGDRGDDTAIASLKKYVRSSSTSTSEATLVALGKIGGPESAQILGMSRLSVRKSLQQVATDAFIQCGWTALEREDLPTALDVFDMLYIDVEPLDVRAQALRGLIRTEQANGMMYIVEALEGDEETLKIVAAEEAVQIPGTEATNALIKVYADLTPSMQGVIVDVLGKRGDKAGMQTVIQAAMNRNPSVRIQALESLAKFREPQVLQPLLKASAQGSEEEKKVARASLASLQGDDINHSLAKMLLDNDNAVRFEAVKMVPIRKASEGIAGLVRIITRGDLPAIQYEALKALCIVGTYEQLPILIEAWVGDTWTEDQRTVIGDGIIAVAKRSPEGGARVEALHNALRGSATPDAQLAVLHALNQIKEDQSIAAMDTLFKKATPEVQIAIMEIWVGWPTVQPLPQLEKQARTQDDVTLRDMAYDGLVHMLIEVADSESVDRLKYIQKTAKIANTSDKRKAILPATADIPREDAEKIWARFLKSDESLSEDIDKLKAE